MATIADSLAAVRARIEAAARHAGRSSSEIELMGVTKQVEPRRIREAYEAGLRLFGENRVQEFAEKINLLRDLPDAKFHLIGHLQTNKATRAAELFAGVDSLDSVRLAEKLNAAAATLGKKLAVLIEINLAAETAKAGLAPDTRELEELLAAAPRLAALEFRGLMAIPPHTDDPEGARPYFRALRELREAIRARNLPAVGMQTFSIGMSHDFEVAIEEGSTCIRIGTAIFGDRHKKPAA
ncbi:MAG: YggS family pyridoxal phosphate-dependent enzyme [Acidobacteriota bacterium]|nr:YggS family pyridoxal phosphate-dependent enzyme [Acidobacteriota bacterium]